MQSFLHNLLRNAYQTPDAEAIGSFCTPEPAALHFKTLDSRPLGTWTREEIAAHRAEAHKAISELHSDNVFASTQAALAERCGVETITMEHTAAAIYLVRNPLDLVVSRAAYESLTIDEAILRLETDYESENSDQFAYEFQGNWSTHVLSWTQQRHAGLHILRYEDLLASPEDTFSPLVVFFGFDTPPERIARAIQFSSFSELAAKEKNLAPVGSSGQSGKIFRVGKAEQWRDVLSAQQVSRIVDRHAKQMERFGYIPDDY